MATDRILNSITIISYNSRGFNQEKQEICKTLAVSSSTYHPIICNQENFLLQANGYKVEKCLSNHKVFFKGAKKVNLEGRGRNGMFIAVPKELEVFAKEIKVNHWRLQAITLALPTSTVLLINSYFPNDPKVRDFDTDDLVCTLSSINDTIQNSAVDSVIWTGDINADFLRGNKFTEIVSDFVEDKSFVKSWDRFPIDFTYSFDVGDHTTTSILDHFFWSDNISSAISKADVLHLPGNTSDHCPIFCEMDVMQLPVTEPIDETRSSISSWKNATSEQLTLYAEKVKVKLKEIETAGNEVCVNPKCNFNSHKDSNDEHLMSLIDVLATSSKESIPASTGGKKIEKKNSIPFWDKVQPFKEKAVFWHSVWQSAGRPLNTVLHQIMKKTRNSYHLQIRKMRKAADSLKRNKFLQACIDNKNDIFTLIRKDRKASKSLPTMIDGTSENIEEVFAGQYGKLYNSSDDQVNMHKLTKDIEDNIHQYSHLEIDRLTGDIVQEAASKLKGDKKDPCFSLNSDCLKRAPMVLFEHLAAIFRQFLIHGYVSNILLMSSVIPLIKDQLSDITSSDNYRSIAISSLILKVLDYVIIILYGNNLIVDELQFGYIDHTSTSMCTWLVVETIEFFQRHGTDVYACVMDMSKAFDRVKHSKLFLKLYERDVPPIVLRMLMYMYSNQEARVQWNNKLSKSFPINNGVKQGAVLSPRFFNVYIDDLFKTLRKEGNGCWVNGMFAGVVGYADDIILLSPTLDGLQDMVSTCEKFAKSHDLTFSTNDIITKCKTKCISFSSSKTDLRSITLNGKALPWVNRAKHLGCKLTSKIHGLGSDIMEKRAQFINKAIELDQEFYFANDVTRLRVNDIFNTSFYGSQLWNLFGNESQRLEKSWNVALRVFLRMPRNSHKYFIEPLSGQPHLKYKLLKKFVNFVNSIKTSDKKILRNTLQSVMYDCRSTTGNNLRKTMLLLNGYDVNCVSKKDIERLVYDPIPVSDEWKVEFAKEIIDIKNNRLVLQDFSNKELNGIMEQICT